MLKSSTQNLMVEKLKKLRHIREQSTGQESKHSTKLLNDLSSLRLNVNSTRGNNGCSATTIYPKTHRQVYSKEQLPTKQNVPPPPQQQNEGLKNLLREKDRQLQQCIQRLLKNESQYSKELEQIDMDYEEYIGELHQALFDKIQRNKQLQDKLNMMNLIGLEHTMYGSNLNYNSQMKASQITHAELKNSGITIMNNSGLNNLSDSTLLLNDYDPKP